MGTQHWPEVPGERAIIWGSLYSVSIKLIRIYYIFGYLYGSYVAEKPISTEEFDFEKSAQTVTNAP